MKRSTIYTINKYSGITGTHQDCPGQIETIVTLIISDYLISLGVFFFCWDSSIFLDVFTTLFDIADFLKWVIQEIKTKLMELLFKSRQTPFQGKNKEHLTIYRDNFLFKIRNWLHCKKELYASLFMTNYQLYIRMELGLQVLLRSLCNLDQCTYSRI